MSQDPIVLVRQVASKHLIPQEAFKSYHEMVAALDTFVTAYDQMAAKVRDMEGGKFRKRTELDEISNALVAVQKRLSRLEQ